MFNNHHKLDPLDGVKMTALMFSVSSGFELR